MKTCAIIFFAAVIFIITGCSTPFTYESVEWRIAVDAPENASAVVKYNGIGVSSKKEDVRIKAVEELKELAADKNPSSPITSELIDTTRKVYLEDGRVVIEEAGKIRNPLSWFVQTGLNPFSWFDDKVNLTINRNHIIKNIESTDGKVLATSGQVMDEDTFETILKGEKFLPMELNRDTQWQRHDLEPIEEEVFPETLQVIVWPRSSRAFYWKFNGPAAGKDWQSLAEEFKIQE